MGAMGRRGRENWEYTHLVSRESDEPFDEQLAVLLGRPEKSKAAQKVPLLA
jgi:hypothetical protein